MHHLGLMPLAQVAMSKLIKVMVSSGLFFVVSGLSIFVSTAHAIRIVIAGLVGYVAVDELYGRGVN